MASFSLITDARRGRRQHIAKQYQQATRLDESVFSDLMAEVCRATSGDKCGYFGDEPGVPAVVPAGSLVVFSSLVFHRSGFNTTDRMRRAYVTQYSPEPIYKPGTHEPMHLDVPFLKDGANVYRPQRQAVVA
jgi:ectoine hydroxylase-related dioxygenase (phytanoyl-CoA dioxygenase family)